jgi:hypothetical protein
VWCCINTITSMVLISIHPFGLRKVFLVIVAFLCFSALCFADPVLMVHRYTSPSEHFPAAKTAAGSQEALVADPGFGPLGSIDSLGDQTELRFTQPGRMGLTAISLPSSVFRKAMCELRSTDCQARITLWPNLPVPGDN